MKYRNAEYFTNGHELLSTIELGSLYRYLFFSCHFGVCIFHLLHFWEIASFLFILSLCQCYGRRITLGIHRAALIDLNTLVNTFVHVHIFPVFAFISKHEFLCYKNRSIFSLSYYAALKSYTSIQHYTNLLHATLLCILIPIHREIDLNIGIFFLNDLHYFLVFIIQKD